jgi:ferredoxin
MNVAGAIHRCTVVDGDASATFEVREGQRLLHEMVAHHATAISVGCRGGGCGVCRVRVLEGTYTTRRMSRRHVTEADEADGIVLACRTIATSDLVVRCEAAPVPTMSSA